MRTIKTFAATAGAMLLLYAGTSLAQGIKIPAPSPTQTIKQDFALSNIALSYSRPLKNGRVIMGDLVPYGKVWRTGANSATTITFGEDVKFGDVAVKAGKYGLLTIPGAQSWTVILTSSLDVTSPAAYKAENDIARVKVKPVALPFSQESFTIEFEKVRANSVVLALSWDKTKVPVVITADIDGKITAQIEEAMQSAEKKPYFQAAVYYFENGKDLNKAVEWIDEATKQSPDAFFIWYQKARINAKAKNIKVAKEAAQKSIELATAAKNDDYVALNKKLLATL
jgi:hypothetical protein